MNTDCPWHFQLVSVDVNLDVKTQRRNRHYQFVVDHEIRNRRLSHRLWSSLDYWDGRVQQLRRQLRRHLLRSRCCCEIPTKIGADWLKAFIRGSITGLLGHSTCAFLHVHVDIVGCNNFTAASERIVHCLLLSLRNLILDCWSYVARALLQL